MREKNRKGRRQGSYTVFLVMAFSAMLILVYAVLSAAGKIAISSTTESFGRIWGTSILAEYDLNLKDRYGIFGFYGEPSLIESKLDEYAAYTFQSKKYISYGSTSCNLEKYSLAEPENLKKQILEAVKFGTKPHGIQKKAAAESPSTGADRSAEASASTGADLSTVVFASPEEVKEDTGYGSRSITSRWILDSLPSKRTSTGPEVSSLAESIKKGATLSNLVGTSMVNRYIFTYFHHNRSTADLGDTYFKNEIEYILCGKTDDEKALKNIRYKLVILRNLLNLAYLYGSPEKREIAMTVATALTPGPEAVLTQGVLMELWAFAEAENDIRLLYADQKVPLLKKDRNWALTLENAMGGEEGEDGEDGETEGNGEEKKEKGGYIRPEVIEGQTYEEYLRILINTVSEQTRLLRIMDLIQINMKYLYCDYFLLSDFYTGLEFSLEVDGEIHSFEESYQRGESNEEEAT